MPTALKIAQYFHPEVTRVMDAKKPLSLDITNPDIEKGIPKDHANCAGAVACRRQLGMDGVFSTRTMFLFPKKKVLGEVVAIRHAVPPRLYAELLSFDRSHQMEPDRYVMPAPTKRKPAGRSRARATAGSKRFELTVPTRAVGTPARKTGRGHSPGHVRTTHRRAMGLRPILASLVPKKKRAA